MNKLEWLFARQRLSIKMGLERVKDLLTRAGEPQKAFQSILVAGTNGKGSTASTLASILQASGKTTALFTSPHLTYFSERFVVNGKPLADELIADKLSLLKPHAEASEATFFEIVMVLACLLFKDAGVDWAVMEAGMGGRNDATNALEPSLGIITDVDLDHMQILGKTLEAIAHDKAGIMRSGKITLSAARSKALQVLQREADHVGSRLIVIRTSRPKKCDETTAFVKLNSSSWDGLELLVKSPWGRVQTHSPFLGKHQARNVALAVTAAQSLGVAAEAIQQGVARAVWPGRLERILYDDRIFLLDGAHNPAGAKTLAKSLYALTKEKIVVIFGAARDKDIQEMLAYIKGLARELILTQSVLSARAADPHDLEPLIPQSIIASNPREALDKALMLTKPGEVILVAGSLYLIGEIRPLLLGQTGEAWERYQ